MEMVRPKSNFAVICHGDLWPSNVLFRYNIQHNDSSSASSNNSPNEAMRPAEVKFLDFQSSRFSSLATDLILFLFTSVKVAKVWCQSLLSLPWATFSPILSISSDRVEKDHVGRVDQLVLHNFSGLGSLLERLGGNFLNGRALYRN